MSTDTERAAFEAWVRFEAGRRTDKDTHGYADISVELMWRAWQARAAIAQQPATPPMAWAHPDGRVVPVATMESARKDGGAMLSSLSGYTIPCYPGAAIAQQTDALAALRELLEAIESGDSLRGADAMGYAEDVLRGAAIAQPAEPATVKESLTHAQPAWLQPVCRYISDTLASGTPNERTVARTIMHMLPLEKLAQADAQPVAPKGWKLVPVKPTEAMLDAAVQAICYGHGGGFTRIGGPGRCWESMLAAAPAAPTARQPLTLEQLKALWVDVPDFTDPGRVFIAVARAVEKAHGITQEGE
jgi:hypothetical protein